LYQNCSLILKFHLLIPGPTNKISTENRQSKSVYCIVDSKTRPPQKKFMRCWPPPTLFLHEPPVRLPREDAYCPSSSSASSFSFKLSPPLSLYLSFSSCPAPLWALPRLRIYIYVHVCIYILHIHFPIYFDIPCLLESGPCPKTNKHWEVSDIVMQADRKAVGGPGHCQKKQVNRGVLLSRPKAHSPLPCYYKHPPI